MKTTNFCNILLNFAKFLLKLSKNEQVLNESIVKIDDFQQNLNGFNKKTTHHRDAEKKEI